MKFDEGVFHQGGDKPDDDNELVDFDMEDVEINLGGEDGMPEENKQKEESDLKVVWIKLSGGAHWPLRYYPEKQTCESIFGLYPGIVHNPDSGIPVAYNDDGTDWRDG